MGNTQVMGMRGCPTLVTSHHHMRGRLEMLGDEIAEGMVLLQHGEVGRIAHA